MSRFLSSVEEIDNLLYKKREILIRSSYITEKTVKWNGEYMVTLFVVKKL